MIFKNSFTFGFLTKEDISKKERGKNLLELIESTIPKFIPEYVGSYEPLKEKYISPDDAVKFWGSSFLWKRKKTVKSNGSVWFNSAPSHTAFIVNTNSKKIPYEDVVGFLIEAAEVFEIDFAYAHLTSQKEVDVTKYEQWHPIDLGLSSFDLRNGIPNLPWFSIWGQSYTSALGQDVLLNCSAYDCTTVGEGKVSIMLSNNITESEQNFAEFDDERTKVKKLIGPIFWGDDDLIIPSGL